MPGDRPALDALDAVLAWSTIVEVVCDQIPSVEVDHSREAVDELVVPQTEDFAIDSLLVKRIGAELRDEARDRFGKLAAELDRAGFAIVRTR